MRTWTLLVALLLTGTTIAGCIAETGDPGEDQNEAEPADEELLRADHAVATGNISQATTPALAIPSEPAVNQNYPIILAAPTPGQWNLSTTDWSLNATTKNRTGQVLAPAHPDARPVVLHWAFTSDRNTTTGNLTYDVWGEPLEFPDEPTAAHTLRPGIYSEVCTTNYLFQYKWQRIFIGTAAHCITGADNENGECSATEAEIGDDETLEGEITVTHAYSSWTTMNAVEDCVSGNDFGLFEVPAESWPLLHPKAHGIVGHVRGIGDCRELTPSPAFGGSGVTLEIVGYGRSSLRTGLGLLSQPDLPVDDKIGEFLEADYGGYQCHVYLATPGIPGDSGGPLATDDGLALGAASTVSIAPTPGSNHYTNIQAALEFMQEHEGWSPELITSA